ncbi:PREDICTED: putative F-box/kelch-repeat protein At4g34170 [Camelina sativa]|uniref:F-box/kelch-repeat protein At4g34170 n=1 Tax=Camelina sativa TaxID=90675 RepID=A0ABM1RIM5_CAMSA|nr:PREDICTED: putative F-box/kelch-repeat protein At4g34170 [Camelina sativa]
MNDGEVPMTLMMLPNDLVLNCLARVSRLYYPSISLVSHRFRSILASTELYQIRSLLGQTESCLYIPNSSKKILIPVTSPNSPCTYQSDFARVGSNIYAIGGFIKDDNASSASIMVMDCRSHTWHEAPSMRVARESPSACVLDGKIYVIGGSNVLDTTHWVEVFVTVHKTWEFGSSSSPGEKICSGFRYQSVGCDGNVYVKCFERPVTYKLNKGRWRAADLGMNRGWWCSSSNISSSSYCVIENVLYCYCHGMINSYNPEKKGWTYVKGLNGLAKMLSPDYRCVDAKVADYGGKLAVLWEENVPVNEYHLHGKVVYCGIIALEKHQGNICGTLEWYDVVYATTEPDVYDVAHFLAVTL